MSSFEGRDEALMTASAFSDVTKRGTLYFNSLIFFDVKNFFLPPRLRIIFFIQGKAKRSCVSLFLLASSEKLTTVTYLLFIKLLQLY